ncbi:MAG: ribonuclease D [Desulfobacteraceae bacterium]|nr:MAG: ribonuclease D [Desulfobacteraceae bacterium]
MLDRTIVGVDLEADSMHCFREKVCLIQIADEQEAYVVDPLSLSDFSPFKTLMETPSVTKVFHGSDFDIRSLDRDFNIRVNGLFDTEIACRFLGVRQRGLGTLLEEYFNVQTDKKYQRYDWSKRPLNDEMIDYSRTDVAHLVDLAGKLTRGLNSKQRTEWAKEEFEIQSRVRYECNHTLPLFKKFKGAGRMDNRSLAVLENLLKLRLDIAKKKDVPLFKVFGTDAIKQMVVDKPKTMAALKQSRALSKKQMNMYAGKCLEAIGSALVLSSKDLPSYPKFRKPRLSRDHEEMVKALKQLRDRESERVDIEPGFLLNNATITALVLAGPENTEALGRLEGMRNWQVQAIGQEILDTLKQGA